MPQRRQDTIAAALLRDALVWDDHAGFEYSAALNLERLWRWKQAGVDYLSINAGYDVMPWTYSIAALAAYRHFIAAHSERYLLVARAADVTRAKAAGKQALAFDMEGMCCLNEDPAMVQFYYDNGVRQMNFAYNLNNAAGGGCHSGTSLPLPMIVLLLLALGGPPKQGRARTPLR